MDSTARYGIHRLLTRRVLTLTSVFIIALLAVFWVGWLLALAGVWSPEDGVPKIDFYAFWSASKLALAGDAAAAYDAETIWREQRNLPGKETDFFPWLNPPIAFFYVLPLAVVPLTVAFVAWVGATGALALSAIRRISADRTVLLLALAFPATLWNVVIGQNGFLTVGLLAWAVLLLRDRPVAAGVLFGLIAYKPQFFPMVLVALLASKQRAATLSAISTIAMLSIASLAVFGAGAWEAFVTWAFRSGDSMYGSSAEIQKMQSIAAVLLLLDLPTELVQVVQAGVAIICARYVAKLWRSEAAIEYKGAGLALAVVLATPYSFHYDLTLAGLAVLWLALRFQEEGWLRWDAEILVLGWLAPLLAVLSASIFDFTIGPLVILLLALVLARRVRQAPPLTADAKPPARAVVAV
jgi:hypothetical protein